MGVGVAVSCQPALQWLDVGEQCEYYISVWGPGTAHREPPASDRHKAWVSSTKGCQTPVYVGGGQGKPAPPALGTWSPEGAWGRGPWVLFLPPTPTVGVEEARSPETAKGTDKAKAKPAPWMEAQDVGSAAGQKTESKLVDPRQVLQNKPAR